MTGTPSVTLLTGATGFLGSALAGRFLTLGDRVRCVVRGATHAERTRRLRSACGHLPPGASERLEVASGDLDQPELGLSKGEFERLGQDVTRVVHCGARVNMSLVASKFPRAFVFPAAPWRSAGTSGIPRFEVSK